MLLSTHHAANGAGRIQALATRKPAACNCFSRPSACSSHASKVFGSLSGSLNTNNKNGIIVAVIPRQPNDLRWRCHGSRTDENEAAWPLHISCVDGKTQA